MRRASLGAQALGQTRSHPGLVVEDAPVPRERAGLSRPRDLAPGQPIEDRRHRGVVLRRRHDLLGDSADRDAAEQSHRAAIFAVGVDVAGQSPVILPVAGHEDRVDPARSHPGAEEMEGVHRDRHVRPGLGRRLAVEASVLGNEGGVDVQAGIEEGGMEPVTLHGQVHRKGNPCPRLIGVAPEAADALEGRTVGQAGRVEEAVEAIRRDLPAVRSPRTGLQGGRIGGVRVVLYGAGDVEVPGGRLREPGALHPEGRAGARRLEVEMDPDRLIHRDRQRGLVQEIADDRLRESECLDRGGRHRLQNSGGGKHDPPEDAVIAEEGEPVEVDEDLEA